MSKQHRSHKQARRPDVRFCGLAGIVSLAFIFEFSAPFPARAGAAFDMLMHRDVFLTRLSGFEEVCGASVAAITNAGRAYETHQVYSSAPGNAFWPGEAAVFTFQFVNKSGKPLDARGSVITVRYGTAQPGCTAEGTPRKLIAYGVVDTAPIAVNMASNGYMDVTFQPKIPETFGAYMLIADLKGIGRQIVSSCVRVPMPEFGRVFEPQLGLDVMDGYSPESMAFYKRLGVKAIRTEVNYHPVDFPDFHEWFANFARGMKTCQDNDVMVMVTSAAGGPQPFADDARPNGWWRSPLDANDLWKRPMGDSGDVAWLPSYDKDYQKWCKIIAGSLGYPKGPINAFELWNEPWEVASISGWGADCLRYREIYTAMAQGIEEARKENRVKVLIGGASSSMNTDDKLVCDGTDTFLKWLDFASLHYQNMWNPSALFKDYKNRQSPMGPIRCWDTESWMVSTEDRVGVTLAAMLAAGYQRVMGMGSSRVIGMPETYRRRYPGGSQELRVIQAFPASAGLAAFQHFVGERKFKHLLFQNGLPWVLVFDGLPTNNKPNPDDSVMIVIGDMAAVTAHDFLLFRSVRGLGEAERAAAVQKKIDALKQPAENASQEAKDAYKSARQLLQHEMKAACLLTEGSMTLPSNNGMFVLYDFYGNTVPPGKDGNIVVPLNDLGYFLSTDHSTGSFSNLVEAVKTARIGGYEPLDVMAHDLTDRITNQPTLRLTLTCIYNRPVSGTLKVKLGSLKLEPAEQNLEFAGNETKEVLIKVVGGEASADNTYPLSLSFDGGEDGKKEFTEDMHVNLIAMRTIAVDGDLSEWKDVLPQPCSSEGSSVQAGDWEKAWKPWEVFDEELGKGLALGYLAYDENNFYFAAKIADDTPDEGAIRFATRNEDEYFYPEKSYRLVVDSKTGVTNKFEMVWPKGVRRYSYRVGTRTPMATMPWDAGDNIQIAFNAIPLEQKDWLSSPPGTPPRFSVCKGSDYIYALNKVADKWGGGTELWRLLAPGLPRKHYFPRQPKAAVDGGPVEGARLAMRRQGNMRIVEAAVPWSELPEVKKRLDAGETLKFSYRVGDNKGPTYQLAANRSVSKDVQIHEFQPHWERHWSNELEFEFER